VTAITHVPRLLIGRPILIGVTCAEYGRTGPTKSEHSSSFCGGGDGDERAVELDGVLDDDEAVFGVLEGGFMMGL
jgi:hypothetical protein